MFSEVDHTDKNSTGSTVDNIRKGETDMSEDSEAQRHHDVEHLAQAARAIQENRTGLVLTGRIKNGELHLDQPTLDEIRRKYPDADVSFIAMNSPFDAESQAV